MPALIEDFPFISTAQLRRAGVFTSGGVEVTIPMRTGHVVVSYREDEGRLVLTAIGRQPQRINMIARGQRYGDQLLFECPKTRLGATKLYLRNGVFASGKGHGLKYSSNSASSHRALKAKAQRLEAVYLGSPSKGPARGERRRAVISALLDPLVLPFVSAEGKARLGREAHVDRRMLAGEVAKKADLYSTDFALDRAQERQEWSRFEILGLLDEFRISELQGTVRTFELEPMRPEYVDRYPRLDIRVLRRRGLLPGAREVTAAHLAWMRENTGRLSFVLLVGREADAFGLNLEVFGRDKVEGVDYKQTIYVQAERDRWFFRCPLSNRRATILYLREGRFGCKEALELKMRLTAEEIDAAA